MNGAVWAGAGLAVGVLLILSGLFPVPPPLAAALDHLDRTSNGASPSPDHGAFIRMLGAPLARTHLARSLSARFAGDLRVTGRAPEGLVTRQLLCALVGLAWAPATTALMTLGGVSVPLALPLWSAVILAAAGFVVPLLSLRMDADQRRRGFRHALSCFLDLVAVRLAGGAGVESALGDSADAGHGWAFTELRQALTEARLNGDPPWAGLERLGNELDIAELTELAASVTLAGDEGARVRSSIAAKARAIRTRGLADAESAAQAASERMSLPIVLLMLGFVVFIGYPAVTQVLTGL